MTSARQIEMLRAYFADELVGAAGVRSFLTAWTDYGPIRPTASDASTSPPSAVLAGNALRLDEHVRLALRRLPARHRRVLRAGYTPAPLGFPHGLSALGELRVVAAVVWPDAEGADGVVAGVDDLRSRLAAGGPAASSARRLARSQARLALERALAAFGAAAQEVAVERRQEALARRRPTRAQRLAGGGHGR